METESTEKEVTKEPTMAQLLEALSQELNGIRRSIRDLESRISRFDRMFESAFKDEAERRLGLKNREYDEAAKCSQMSQLEQLKWELNRGK